MKIPTGIGAVWLIGASLSAIVWARPAAAQAQAAADYGLPAQDLGQTLRAIAQASGQDILFPAGLVQGRTAPAIKGRLTLDEALRRALAGSGLVVDHQAGAVLIRAPAAVDAQARPDAEASSITVTGTRIRGAGSASPVIVNSRRSLEEAGITDLAAFTRILPQNYTGGQNPGVAGVGQQGGQSNLNNSATLNLRGLGPDATLTLIDGHRVAYDALNQGIDISAIPLAAVERIEVVTDGASALYGSDAVGGVANIILRRQFDGLETTARAGASTDGGNVQQQFSAVAGARWASGGFMLALDHSRTSAIHADQRSYTRGLDPSLTLTLRNVQSSAVLAGHQQLAPGLSLELDAFVTDRHSHKQVPFSPDADVRAFGQTTDPDLRSFALTPTVRAELPGRWEASLSGTRARSRTHIETAFWVDQSAFRSRLLYQNSLSGVEATAEGPLFHLPGGSARLAAGGGLRKVALHVDVSDRLDGQLVPFQVFTEKRTVSFAYGELSLPLIGPDQHIPLVRRLTLSAALRYERWKGIDKDATPKLGLIYEPSSDATIRATWGKSFKVPTLNQVNEVVQGVLFPGAFFDPQPEPPLAPDATVLLIGGGNPNLRAERATTWSATLELHPHLIDGLELRGTYFDIDFRDRITTPISDVLSALPNPLYQDLIVFDPTAEQVDALVAGLPLGLSNQAGAPFDPANVAAIISTGLRNTAREHLRGFDLDAEYRIRLAERRALIISATASYLRGDLQITPSQPLIPRAGTIFNAPHWRGRASATWQSVRADASASVNYVGSVRDNRFPDGRRIAPFVTIDASAALRTDQRAGALRNVELRLSALNLLNQKPHRIRNSEPEAPSYDSTNQSPLGRFIGLAVRKSW